MVSGIGISAYSVYSGQTESIYGLAPVSDVKNSQKPKDAEKPQEQEDIEDTATISDEAKQLLANDIAEKADKLPAERKTELNDDKNKETSELTAEKKVEFKDDKEEEQKTDTKLKTKSDLTQAEQQEVQQLKARDAEVRAHEQAHIAAAVGLQTSAPSYEYQAGPDGKKYAVGGEVGISFTSSGNPDEDIQNAETMRDAALAPTEPSGQDRAVAKNAEKIIQDAKEKLAEQQEQQKEQITQSETAKTLVGS